MTLAEVSQDRRAIVIGEDLGVVPPGFRDVMRATEIQSYRVFFFEMRDDFFLPPEVYPREALACLITHDLYTLAGWWSGHAVDVRREIGMISTGEAHLLQEKRAHERRRLLGLLADQDLLPAEMTEVMRGEADAPRDLPQSVAVALHRLLARTPSRLFAVAAEDLDGLDRSGEYSGHDRRAPELAAKAALRHRGPCRTAAVSGDRRGGPCRAAKMIRPSATYRLQFRNGVTFETAAALAPYLRSLGISHLYASPIFTAVPGSTHGYDVTDFREIDPALGGREGFEKLAAAMEAEGIGLILDFVPNHMGASPFNPWWRDILEWGQDSDYREHFDIDWSSPKLLVPVLGELYGEALQSGKLGLAFDAADGGMSFTYHELRLPLSPPLLCAHPRPHRRGAVRRSGTPLRRRSAGDGRRSQAGARNARTRSRRPCADRRRARSGGGGSRPRCTSCTRRRSGAPPTGARRAKG